MSALRPGQQCTRIARHRGEHDYDRSFARDWHRRMGYTRVRCGYTELFGPVARKRLAARATRIAKEIMRFGQDIGDCADTPKGYMAYDVQRLLERLADGRLAVLDVKHALQGRHRTRGASI